MIIKQLTLHNFRNYEDLDIAFDSGCNILYGDNAQGKTNILEAVYVCGTSRSHKGAKDREMIRFKESEAHLRAMIEVDERDIRIDIHLRKNKTKGIAINGRPIKRAGELFGLMHMILFSPEDLNIVKNGPAERRRFIDMELCQLDSIYMSDLANYNKILNQRNKLLKDIQVTPSLKDTLDVWDMQLTEYGKRIIRRRKEFVLELKDITTAMHQTLTGGKEELLICYEPSVSEEMFEDSLFIARDRDLRNGQTSVGPHRDDLKFEIDHIDIRTYGSQGQQRTCALSLKLSEIQLVERHIHEKPLLLLDDVLSELDSSRQNYLLNGLEKTQTIITCTGMDDFVRNRFEVDRVYEIIQGTAHLQGEKTS